MSQPFKPSRDDGRSDRRVVYELVSDAEPGTVFTKDDLRTALEEGVDVDITDVRVGAAVRSVRHMLLRERQRYLISVPGIGYRMIRSDEHLPVALGKKQRAEMQLRDGIEILRNTDVSELSEAQRSLHQGQLLIVQGVYQFARASEKRIKEQGHLIEQLRTQQTEINDRLMRLEEGAA
jgi:DNA-binding winged helix-turn-helix (wHTH) protein